MNVKVNSRDLEHFKRRLFTVRVVLQGAGLKATVFQAGDEKPAPAGALTTKIAILAFVKHTGDAHVFRF